MKFLIYGKWHAMIHISSFYRYGPVLVFKIILLTTGNLKYYVDWENKQKAML